MKNYSYFETSPPNYDVFFLEGQFALQLVHSKTYTSELYLPEMFSNRDVFASAALIKSHALHDTYKLQSLNGKEINRTKKS